MAMAIDEYRLEINHLPSAQLPLLKHHSAIKEAFFLFLVSPDQSHCRGLQKKKKQQNLASLQCFFLAYAFLFLSSVPTGETHQRTTKAAAKKKNINSFMLAGKKVGENGQQQKGGGKSESTKDKKNKREKGGSYCK